VIFPVLLIRSLLSADSAPFALAVHQAARHQFRQQLRRNFSLLGRELLQHRDQLRLEQIGLEQYKVASS
jgi:hypothetical protein